jgi:hypothetical protein
LPTGAITDVFASRTLAGAAGAAAPADAGAQSLDALAAKDGPVEVSGGKQLTSPASASRTSPGVLGSAPAGPAGGTPGGGGANGAAARPPATQLAGSLSGKRLQLGQAAAAGGVAAEGGSGWGRLGPGSLGQHDALEDGSLTAALIAAGAIKAPGGGARGGAGAQQVL